MKPLKTIEEILTIAYKDLKEFQNLCQEKVERCWKVNVVNY
jgi:hypothetical protein